MFKEKYKRDMEKVKPSEEAYNKTMDVLLEEANKKPRRSSFKQLAAIAVCVCIVVGSFGIMIFNNNDDYNDMVNPYVSRPDSNSMVQNSNTEIKTESSYYDIFKKMKIVTDNQEKAPTTGESSKEETDYSETNNQVEGIQEADIVKTDGKYIYACGKSVSQYYYDEGIAYDDISYGGKKNKEDTIGKVYIVSADNGNLDLVSTIKIRDEYEDSYYTLKEILLYENTLILIKNGYNVEKPDTSDYSDYYDHYYYRTYLTSVEIYDITDKANPVFKNELYQSGNYISSRMVGKDLYIITNHTIYNPDKDNPATYIPYCSSYDENYLVPSECIYIPKNVESSIYTVITGIDVTQPENHKSNAAILGFSGTVYSSQNNIYVASYHGNNSGRILMTDDVVVGSADINQTQPTKSIADIETASNNAADETAPDKPDTIKNNSIDSTDESEITNETWAQGQTNIYRFSIENGIVEFKASGSVDGRLINQFAMDEYNDMFRVATTVNIMKAQPYQHGNGKTYYYSSPVSNHNNVYILDQNLKITGRAEKIAPDERIYSVRFDGEIGYVVTFRQVDPLFAIDLSDKTSPKILSALKIPGFSTYMHPYGEGLLFGFGQDADENNGWSQGLKLSMFDVSDKTDVTEKSILKLGANYYYSEALNNHKAILVDTNKNLIGFPVQYTGYNYNKTKEPAYKEDVSSDTNIDGEVSGPTEAEYTINYGYVFYKYENDEFVKLGSISLTDIYKWEGLRGLYIGDYLYIVSADQFISSYDIHTFEEIDTINFS